MNKLMRLGGEGYPQTESCGSVNRSIRDNLQQQKDRLEEKLSRVNAALDALDKQPAVAELLETVLKAV